MRRLAWIARVALVAGSALLPQRLGEDWPAKPVTIVVPFVAGGTTDIVARIIAQALSERLHQSIVIENVGGGGGTIGAGNAARAPAGRLHDLHGDRRPHHGARHLQEVVL